MNIFRSLFIFCLFGSLSGCSIMLDGINAAGEKWFADDYVFTSADGTTNRYWNLAKDNRPQLKADTLYLRKFDLNASALRDTTTRRRTHMELTASNLKEIAAQHHVTIFMNWNPVCGPSLQGNTMPALRMLNQLSKSSGIKLNQSEIGLVFASINYQFARMDYHFNTWKFPYQSYVIPSPVYPEKILLKEIFFNRELCPECYAAEKDDISKYFIFAIDKNGKVIDKVAARYTNESIDADLDRFAQKIKASIL